MHTSADQPGVIGWAYAVSSVVCNALLLLWGIVTLLKEGGPRGEELAIVYWWVTPLIMLAPAQIALHSWLNRWQLSKVRLLLLNVPFALAIAVWIGVLSLPT